MLKLIILSIGLLILSPAPMNQIIKNENDPIKDCEWKEIPLKGKVQFVDNFGDIKVQFVESFPDLKVKFVDNFADDCGEWEVVESFPDFKVQVVENFADIKIQIVESFPGMP